MYKAIVEFTTQGQHFAPGEEVRTDMFDADFLMQPLINKGLVQLVETEKKPKPANKVAPSKTPAKNKAGKEK